MSKNIPAPEVSNTKVALTRFLGAIVLICALLLWVISGRPAVLIVIPAIMTAALVDWFGTPRMLDFFSDKAAERYAARERKRRGID